MRIIYLGTFRLPNYDAAAARVLNVARALRLAGHDVEFISWGGKEQIECKDTGGVSRVDGFPFVVTDEMDFKGGPKGKLFGWLKQGSKTKAILRERLGTYDAIITYNVTLIRWLSSFCDKNGIKLISDLTEWYSSNELKTIQIPGYFFDMYFAQKKIKNKIVISSYFDKYYKQSHNIIVPATCDATEEKWHLGKDKAFTKAGAFDGITLIYAGTPAKKDALHYVIGAVNRLANEGAKLRFLILGCNREDYIRRFKEQLPQGDLNANIQFLGRIPQDEVPSFYSLADFMVLLREPTRKSNAGFPTKFAESFTSGTPVIANLTSDLGNYLKDGVTGFVVSEPSEESIYNTLKERVLPLQRIDVESIKNNVRVPAKQLEYHSFIEPLYDFMNNLK